MRFEIRNRRTGKAMYQGEAESFSALVREAIRTVRRSDLCGSDLRGADLSYLFLNYLDFRGSDLRGADLRGAYFPSPTAVLSAYWGELSDELTADLMEYDAFFHPNRAAFDAWAQGGPCPYTGTRIQRAALFDEKRELWGKGKLTSGYDLMVRVLREKTKTDLGQI